MSHRTGNASPGADARAHYRYFNGGDRGASAHYFVDAKEIVRIIPEDEIAYHAGPANGDTIGIELCEPAGDWQGGYPAYVELHADICRRYGLDPLRNIRGHFEIDPINRPQDPIGLFKWDPFLQDVAHKLTEMGGLQKTPIMGRSMATAHQLRQLLKKRNPDAPDYGQDYLDIGNRYGIRGDIAFCQSIHETGAWRFGGQVLPEQNNFAGLGATNGGARGASFASPHLGIEAQIQHLYLYANDGPLPLNMSLLDPRWDAAVSKWGRGAAPNVEDLAGKWAVPGYDPQKYGSYAEAFTAGVTYGQSILKLLNEALSYPAEPEQPSPDAEKEDLRTQLAAAQTEIETLKAKIAKALQDLA